MSRTIAPGQNTGGGSARRELYLVRHGQASWGEQDYDQLSQLGREQARWLGEHFAELGLRFDRVATGALRRHRETMDELSATLGQPCEPVVLGGLDEFSFMNLLDAWVAKYGTEPGIDGDIRAQMRRLRQALYEWADGRLTSADLEPWAAFVGRVSDAMGQLFDAKTKRVLVVSSGGPIAVAVARALGASDDVAIELNLRIRNTGVTKLDVSSGGLRLHEFNTTPHLVQAGRLAAITYF